MSYQFTPNVEQLESREAASSLLIERAIADRPQIAAATNDWQKVNQIREWAYQQIDNSTIGDGVTLDFHGMTPEQMLAAFDADQAGVNCGGASYFLAAAYNAFGFDAATVGGGTVEKGHMVTLVRIEAPNGNTVESVQDALVNVTYATGDNPYDFGQIQRMLADGETPQLVSGESVGRDALASEELHAEYLADDHDLFREPESVRDGVYKWQSDLNADWIADNWHPNPIELFAADTIINPENWRYAEIDAVFSAYTVNGGPRVIVERDGQTHRDFWAFSPAVVAANAVIHDDWVWTSAPTGLTTPGMQFHVKAFDIDETDLQMSYYA